MAEKDTHIRKFEAQLREWNAEIEKLRARRERAQAEAQQEIDRRITEVEGKRAGLERDLDRLREAGEETWRDVLDQVDSSWRDFKAAVDKAIAEAQAKAR